MVVLTREKEDNDALALALAHKGVDVISIPCVATRYLVPDKIPDHCDAVTFSSRRGVRGIQKAGLLGKLLNSSPAPLLGVVGKSTGDELRKAGYEPDVQADPPEGRVLARILTKRLEPGQRVLTVRGNLRAGVMDGLLSDSGLEVVALEV